MAVKTEAPNDTVSTDRIEKRVVLRAPARACGAPSRTRKSLAPGSGSTSRALYRRHTDPGQDGHPGLRACDVGNGGRTHRPGAVPLVSLAPLRRRPAVDYSAEPTTLVEFRLEETEAGPRSQCRIRV